MGREGENHAAEEPRQTRPSAIVERPMRDDPIGDCSTAELLTEVIARATSRRATDSEALPAKAVEARNRELSIAITHAEDCLTRHNKAVYIERGVYAITDAELVPDVERPRFS